MSKAIPYNAEQLLADYAAGLSLALLGAKHGVSAATIRKWLRAQPEWIDRGYPRKTNCHPIVDGRRQCRTCQAVKPIDEFPRHSSSSLRVLAHCRVCTAIARSDYSGEVYAGLRRAVIAGYGGACKTCGFTDARALHVDHVHDDGAAERRSVVAIQRLRRIIRDQFPASYQLLCANCNSIKAHQSGLFSRTRRRKEAS
jgi:hypothetical protein